MLKYTSDIVAGYILYFTSKCVIEAMHVHASDRAMTEKRSAILYVYENGDTKVERFGMVNEKDMKKIQQYIKNNHEVMYQKWIKYSDNGYYKKRGVTD